MEKVIFKEQNEEIFWKYWGVYLAKNEVSPKYLESTIKYLLAISGGNSFLYKDKSFIYLQEDGKVSCVFLPIEKKNGECSVTFNGDFAPAPIFDSDKKLERKTFALIDQLASENNVSKIMFSVDPLESVRYPFNYLQKYGYLDASLLVYFIDTRPQNLLKACRDRFQRTIKSVLKNNDFSVFYTDKNNPDRKLHREYETLHHKCSGRITRPQETFDIQYEELKNGNAVLFGLKYKDKNVAYLYCKHNGGKALTASAADDPDYDRLPLYHPLMYSAMEYYKKKGVDLIDTGQPSAPSAQFLYYPDEKQFNIGHFKHGFSGDFMQNFRGIKYFSEKQFKQDLDYFRTNIRISQNTTK